jgi:hypothetical protein
MHSALLVILKPDFELPGKTEAWMEVLRIASTTAKTGTGVEMLADNVLLTSMSSSFSTLCTLVSAIQTKQLSYRVLFFRERTRLDILITVTPDFRWYDTQYFVLCQLKLQWTLYEVESGNI